MTRLIKVPQSHTEKSPEPIDEKRTLIELKRERKKICFPSISSLPLEINQYLPSFAFVHLPRRDPRFPIKRQANNS